MKDNLLKNKYVVLLIRVAVITVVGYFLYQSFFGAEGKGNIEDSENRAAKEAEVLVIDNSEKLPEILENPSKYENDFKLMLEGYSQAWADMKIEPELYNEIAEKKNAIKGLNWLMSEREKEKTIPKVLVTALRDFMGEDIKVIEEVSEIFGPESRLSVVREFTGGKWTLNLKETSELSSSSTKKDGIEFKGLGLD